MFSPAVFALSSLKYVSRLISTGGKEADGNHEAGSHTDAQHISNLLAPSCYHLPEKAAKAN